MKIARKFLILITFLVIGITVSAQKTEFEKVAEKRFNGKFKELDQTNPWGCKDYCEGDKDRVIREGLIRGASKGFATVKFAKPEHKDGKTVYRHEYLESDAYRVEWVDSLRSWTAYNLFRGDMSVSELSKIITGSKWLWVRAQYHEYVTDGRDPTNGKAVVSWLPEGEFLMLVYTDANARDIPVIKAGCYNHVYMVNRDHKMEILYREKKQDDEPVERLKEQKDTLAAKGLVLVGKESFSKEEKKTKEAKDEQKKETIPAGTVSCKPMRALPVDWGSSKECGDCSTQATSGPQYERVRQFSPMQISIGGCATVVSYAYPQTYYYNNYGYGYTQSYYCSGCGYWYGSSYSHSCGSSRGRYYGPRR